MRSHPWVAPDGSCALMTRGQYRLAIAVSLLAVAAFDVVSPLPVGQLYFVPIAFTFWAHDRWLPNATARAGAALFLLGLAATPTTAMQGIDFVLAMRLGNAALLLGAGSVVTYLRRLLAEANEREAFLRTIFDSESACVKLLGPGCVLLDMNRAGLAMVDADDIGVLRGKSVLPAVVEKYRAEYEQLCDATFRGESGALQFELVGLRGRRLWMEVHMTPLRDAADRITAVLGVTSDITERRRAEEQLRDSEQRLVQAAAIAGLGFFEHDHATDAIYWSPGARAIFDVGPHMVISRAIANTMMHPDDRARSQDAADRAHDPCGDGSMTIEARIVRASGEIRHVSVKSQTRFDESGRPSKTVGTLFDVTERVRAESQRDRLALRVLEIQEDERRAVARDLHDEIGQALSALKLNLLCLKRDGTGNDQVVGDSLNIADEVLRQVRDIALSLRPSVLDDLGLGAAVQWYVEHSGARGGIRISCHVAPELAPVAPAVEIACFRVLQEALTNVHRHAGATRAEVWLHDNGRHLELVVCDNGQGFEVEQVIAGREPGSNMGLLSIRERAALLGGEATLSSTPGSGSQVRVRFPLLAATEPAAVGVEV
jgi:two-component system, NarL family, sensor histidine kinase UhpB